jgi:hypothetical protein
LLQGLVPVTAGSSITVTVGAGGAGTNQGNASVFGNISAAGGGYSATAGNVGSGGSGGGGSGSAGTNYPGGSGIVGQGNAGGSNYPQGGVGPCGGGGGAGTVGLTAQSSVAGNGGAGIASAISGIVTTYSGGGGGATLSGTAGSGGAGGGGAGSSGATGSANGTAGTANTGGGGGGGYNAGGAGGSGIVIVSYPDIYAAAASTTGSPTVSTSGSGSIAFTVGGQFLRYAGQTPFVFGTGDFTIECWVYVTSFSNYPTIYDCRNSDGTGNGPIIYFLTNGTLQFESPGGSTRISSSACSINQWYHIAICRISGSTKMYINGSQAGSTYSDSTNYACASTGPVIGNNYGVFASAMNEYISNLRVVKGVGVYTGTFTPATAPLQATQSAGTNIAAITGTATSLLLNSVSGAYLADGSTNLFAASTTIPPTWNQLSPFSTGLGYKNRVYTYTGSGTITF